MGRENMFSLQTRAKSTSEVGSYILSLKYIDSDRHFAHPSLTFTGDEMSEIRHRFWGKFVELLITQRADRENSLKFGMRLH